MSPEEKRKLADDLRDKKVSDELRKIIERDLQTPDDLKREPLEKHQAPIGFDDDGNPFPLTRKPKG